MSQVMRSQKGQSTVILAVVFTALMGMMTISIDAGRVFVAKEQLQSAADAGAIAGAGYLPQDPSQAIAAAMSTAEANGLSSSEISAAVVGALQNEVQVSVRTTEPLIFGPVIGLSSASVSAGATAAAGMPSQMTGLIPIGVYQGTFVPGQTYTLKAGASSCTDGDGSQGGSDPSDIPGNPNNDGDGSGCGCGSAGGSGGNFGALWYGDGDPGANTYEQDLEDGSPAEVTLGETVTTKPGDMVGPTDQGLEARLSAPATPVGDPSSPRFVYVPIITPPANGRTSVTVVGFAAFWLEDVSNGQITGEFLHHVVSADILQTDASTTGLIGVTLVR